MVFRIHSDCRLWSSKSTQKWRRHKNCLRNPRVHSSWGAQDPLVWRSWSNTIRLHGWLVGSWLCTLWVTHWNSAFLTQTSRCYVWKNTQAQSSISKALKGQIKWTSNGPYRVATSQRPEKASRMLRRYERNFGTPMVCRHRHRQHLKEKGQITICSKPQEPYGTIKAIPNRRRGSLKVSQKFGQSVFQRLRYKLRATQGKLNIRVKSRKIEGTRGLRLHSADYWLSS